MKLGSLEIESPITLAPIAGFTDSPYRRIARACGAGFTMTELISSEGIVRKNRKTLELLHFTDEERPIGIQIFGKNPVVMAEAASMAEDLSPDFIDINLGCPARKVCRDGDGAGAALLRRPSSVEKLVSAVVKSVSLPVSAKIRTGWDAASVNYREILEALEAAGVSFISVHGRTRAQGYGGEADWDAIENAAAVSSVPIIGNGDICSRGEAMDRLKKSDCDAVMIGRAACGNPWIFSEQQPTLSERVEMIKRHLNMNMEYYGDWGLVLMRKHTVKYIQGLPFASEVRRELSLAPDKSSVFDILDGFTARQACLRQA